jgi:hypothetical protein
MIRAIGVPVLAAMAISALQPRVAPRADGSIYVSVSDAQGTLTGADVSVSLDGIPAEMIGVVAGPHPVSAVVLFDWSSSMQSAFGRPIERMGRGQILTPGFFDDVARRIARILEPPDRVRFASFGKAVTIGPEVRRNDKSAVKALRDVFQSDGPSPIWDAIDQSFTALEAWPGPTGVIVVSDGRASGNDKGLSDVVNHAARSGAAVYPLAVSQGSWLSHASGYRGLKQIADASGGTFADADAVLRRGGIRQAELLREWISVQIEEAIRDLRSQYRLEFTAPASPRMAGVEVTTRRGRVRARQYFAAPEQSLIPKVMAGQRPPVK